MDKLLRLVEGNSTEILKVEQMDEEMFKEFPQNVQCGSSII